MAIRDRISVDGDRSVSAVHHPADSDRWVVFCHGLRSDKSGSYERRCERIVEAGCNAVRFDFCGCGDSDGTFDESTLSVRIADLRAVISHFDPDRYALFGSSFGAKVAFHAAFDDDRATSIAARAPVTFNRTFDEYREVVDGGGTVRFGDDHLDSRFFDDLRAYPFSAVTSTLDVPVAIFHGRNDESVSLAESLRATERLETAVTLQTFPGEGHRFSEAAERRLLDAWIDWLQRQ